jgi:hypothetical protein
VSQFVALCQQLDLFSDTVVANVMSQKGIKANTLE